MKRFLLAFLTVLILPVSGYAVTGEALINVQDTSISETFIVPSRVKDGGNIGDDIVKGTMTVSPMVYDGTNWDKMRGDTTNGIDVDVTRISGSVITVGNNTPADAYVNPTDALDSNTLVSEFNGTTWDRIRHSFNQSTAGINADASAGTAVDMTKTPMSDYAMVIDRTAGAQNVVEVDIECSLDNSIFAQIGTVTDLSAEPTFTNVNGVPCNYIRYNVVTVGSGNTLTVQLLATR